MPREEGVGLKGKIPMAYVAEGLDLSEGAPEGIFVLEWSVVALSRPGKHIPLCGEGR